MKRLPFLVITFLFRSCSGFVPNQKVWTPYSWRQKTIVQIPKYENQTLLIEVEEKLKKKPPLIFSKECENLKRDLAQAAKGNSFVIMGGDCAETFRDFETDSIRDLYKLLLQLGILQTYITGKKSIKIGRIAGQFAKPRSSSTETICDITLPSYQGDIINGYEFNPESREPDPLRMLASYQQSVQTLNLLRAFSTGGLASLSQFQNWNIQKQKINADDKLLQGIERSFRFLKGLGISFTSPLLSQTTIYTGHECLLLPYEESLTRLDSLTNRYYDCSGHFLWIGDRTRFLNSSHVEFCRGIHNPIGIKISKDTDAEELVKILNILNPTLEYGKITLICRFGSANIHQYLPPILKEVKRHFHSIVWCCDPMHGNTVTKNGVKTRYIEDISKELQSFFDIIEGHDLIPAGIHLEMTPKDVVECISTEDEKNSSEPTIFNKYNTLCDPRLNNDQSIKVLSSLFSKLR
jgi:3-deoxy-7-phosphoheptulonate synthase